jgi:hypothetical protein
MVDLAGSRATGPACLGMTPFRPSEHVCHEHGPAMTSATRRPAKPFQAKPDQGPMLRLEEFTLGNGQTPSSSGDCGAMMS